MSVTWRRLPTGTDNWLFDVWAFPDGRLYACGYEGALLTSPDFGETWSAMSSGVRARLFRMWAGGPDDLWAAGGGPAGAVLLRCRDGKTWKKVSFKLGRAEELQSVSGDGQGRVVVVGRRQVIGTRDGGKTWSILLQNRGSYDWEFGVWDPVAVARDREGSSHPRNLSLADVSLQPGGAIWLVGAGARVLRSVDGAAWESVPVPVNKQVSFYQVLCLGSGIWLAGWGRGEDSGLVLHSHDDGASWRLVLEPRRRIILRAVLPDGDDLLIAGDRLHRLHPNGQLSSELMEEPRGDGVLHRIRAAGPYRFVAGGRERIFRLGPL